GSAMCARRGRSGANRCLSRQATRSKKDAVRWADVSVRRACVPLLRVPYRRDMRRDILRRPTDLRLRSFHRFYTVAPETLALFVTLRRVARAQCTVLLEGETGTGKELIAKAIHAESPRRKALFREVNCATFSPTLLES